MGKNRQHHNSQFIRFFKNAFAIFGFVLPIFMVSVFLPRFIIDPDFPIDGFLALIRILIFSPICSLIAAYFFTDLDVDENGLLIEFLWKKLRVPWNKVLQIKPLFGIQNKKHGLYVVIVEGLTPFHRLYGLIYGFSLKPAFILWPTINDFEVLKNDIEIHIKKNATQNS
jgi:hypothetical protein